MPFKDHQKQLRYLRAWRAKYAAEIRTKKHAYYLAHRVESAERRTRSRHRGGTLESGFEAEKLRSSREHYRLRDVPGEARLPVRLGRRRMYQGSASKRHAASQRVYLAKNRAKGPAGDAAEPVA
jgi:hypothetical protein